MAFFGVTREKIGEVSPIPDADRIVMAKLEGMDFRFVIPKDAFAPGDDCLYFPVDSLLPAELIETLGLTGRLSGKQKNRIKTVKLRGQISQGIVARPDLAPAEMTDPMELTEHLGVEKYEPPVVVGEDCDLVPLPDGLSVYDIEGADRYVRIADELMDQKVIITEKVEGTNFSVSVSKDGIVSVNQRRYSIKPHDGKFNGYWDIAEKMGLIKFVQGLHGGKPRPVAVYGELLGPGIQKNIYGFKQTRVLIFDIRIGMDWLPASQFLGEAATLLEYYLATEMGKEDPDGPGVAVPVLHVGLLRDWLEGKAVKDASNGESKLAPVLREGIVFRPVEERSDDEFGRVIIKQRSPEYLAKSKL
jgi:RNA ligase (TIGR02306 family)